MSSPATDIPRELVAKYDRPGPRYTSYPTVPVWSGAFGPDDFAARLDEADRRSRDPLALYVHLPFCRHRCLFCGCNVVITQRKDVVEEYLEHLFVEIDRVAERLPHRRRTTGLHWGGGTPTHLDCGQIERLHRHIGERFQLDPDGEVAIEVHPPVTTDEQLDLLRALGFSRISLGVQDLDSGVQELIERWQTVEQTERILSHAREIGFQSANFDLIYGLPGQTAATWRFTLDETLRMRPDRLAVYSYAHVTWIKPHQKRMPESRLPGPEMKLALFREARRRFLEAGYVEIGMDHFALPEDELARAVGRRQLYRSFMGYTVRPAPDFLGFGVSAISEVGGAYAQAPSKLNRWREDIGAGRFPVERGHLLSKDDLARKTIIDRLMCNMHVDCGEIEKVTGRPFRTQFARECETLQGFAEDGLIRLEEDCLEVTALGRTLVRNLAMVFDAYLDGGDGETPVFSRTV